MKIIVFLICAFFAYKSFAQVQVPVGNFKYESQSFLNAQHVRHLYNASSVDMEEVQRLRENGYACRRHSQLHACKKTVNQTPFEIAVEPEFQDLNFGEFESVEALVLEADPEQYEVTQSITYDGLLSEAESYKLYLTSTGNLYLDPILGEMVRFELQNEETLSHLNISRKTISRKEYYKILVYDLYKKTTSL